MRRPLQECWRALRAPTLKMSPGSALVLLSAAGTVLAAMLWLEVGVAAAAITYAITLGALLMVLYRHARAEGRAMNREHGALANDSHGTPDHATKKIVSPR